MKFNRTEHLLSALESMWVDLPDAIGDDWPDFEAQLVLYQKQIETRPEKESFTRALILRMFREYPQAHQQLRVRLSEEGDKESLDVRTGAPAWKTIAPTTVTRYTDIACPRRVWVDAPRVTAVVRLTVQPPEITGAEEKLELDQDLPVQIRIDAPAFDVLNAQEQETAVIPDADSPPVVFDLRPREAGPTRVTFDFFQGGSPAGTASVPVEIVEQEVADAPERPPAAQPLHIEARAEPPDLMLYIRREQFAGQPALTFELRRAGDVGRTFYPVSLQVDPQTYAARLYERFTDLSQRIDPTTKKVLGRRRVLPADDVDRRIKQLGQNLWRELIPGELQALYAEERLDWRDKSLLIVSDEPYFPWELVWPYGETWEDEVPWCMSFRLTRWLRRDFKGNGHHAPPAALPLGALAYIVPADSGLPAAQQERAFMRQLAADNALDNLSPSPPTWSAVMDVLEGRAYHWFHAAAHGNFDEATPDADAALWLEGQRSLTPDAFVGPAIERHIRTHRPGFFFNACHSGREGWHLIGLGGWANRLISSGAGLFMGPLWTVTDTPALVFAEALYGALLDGEPVAEAVRLARLAAQADGDPTWLAYSVYAHPNATVIRERT